MGTTETTGLLSDQVSRWMGEMEETIYEKARRIAKLDREINGWHANAPYKIFDLRQNETYIARVKEITKQDDDGRMVGTGAYRVQLERPAKQMASVEV